MHCNKFSESKEILKIGRSEVCVWGGDAKGRTNKSSISVVCYVLKYSEYSGDTPESRFAPTPAKLADHHSMEYKGMSIIKGFESIFVFSNNSNRFLDPNWTP